VSISFWHKRFTQQARWTENARTFIIQKINPTPDFNVLEIGSGTGAVLNQFANEHNPVRYGIDLNRDYLNFNATSTKYNRLIQADGIALPFKDNFFEITYCHYLMLWIENPLSILIEMKRTTRSGGWICLFAEPDYIGRIDDPPAMLEIGKYQNKSLYLQGVRLDTGRNLKNWLLEMELQNIHWGLLGAHESVPNHFETDDQEWLTLESDLKILFGQEELNRIKADYLAARENNRGIIFVPTFYAYGQK
jgi:SAM-dependent methyltransferase